MGAICPASGEGLVGNHAYSILEVRQVTGAIVGEQPKISHFFGAKTSMDGPAKKEVSNALTAEGVLRLIKVIVRVIVVVVVVNLYFYI